MMSFLLYCGEPLHHVTGRESDKSKLLLVCLSTTPPGYHYRPGYSFHLVSVSIYLAERVRVVGEQLLSEWLVWSLLSPPKLTIGILFV